MKTTVLKNLLLGVLLCFVTQTALPQDIDLQNYIVTQFGMEEGLPQSSVNDIIQTKDGYIWLATFGGLVRFDGNTFTTYDRSNTSCLISDRLLKIFPDKDGGIWLFPGFADTIVSRFKNGVCTTYKIGKGVSDVIDMIEDERGIIWLTAFSKVYRFDGNEFLEVPIKKDEVSIQRAKKSKEGVWFGYEKKILHTLRDSVVEVYDSLPGLTSNIIRVYEHPLNSRILLIGTSYDGILEVDLNQDDFNYKADKLPYNYFLSLRFDKKFNSFAITPDGIAAKKESGFVPFNPFDKEQGIRLKAILQDNEGNYWIGTGGNGLFRFRNKIISMIDKDQGLQNEKMLSITQLKNGTKLLSTNCSGIYEWKDGKASLSTIHEYLEIGCFWSVFQDSKDRIWVGGGAPYMTESLDKPGKLFGVKDGYTGYFVFAITEDSKGNIWVASSNGIFIYDGNSFVREITVDDGLFYSDARVLYEDESGVMWVGTNGGLNTIDGDVVAKIELFDNAEHAIPRQPEVRAIYKDKEGAFWIGTYGDGLFRIKEGKIVNITTKDGLFDNVVSHIIADKQGYFWMGSNRGISRIIIQELNDYIDGKIGTIHSYSYGISDGMNSAETNGGFQPSSIVDSLENIYFPTVAGVAIVSTESVRHNVVPPPVYIENLRDNEKSLPLSDTITLAYDNPFLEINYTAICFSDPKKVQFKYRMEGLNDNWIEVGTRREALYSKIPPGQYTFQVIASNNDGVWNMEGASLQIIVVPPYWRTLWFYSLMVLVILMSGFLAYKKRLKHFKKEKEKQKRFTEQLIDSQERERRRIASELHDGLGQQILVIKNRAELAQLQVDNPEEIAVQLSEITKSAVISISDVRTISYGLRPVHLEKFGLTEAINNLYYQIKSTSNIEWSYHIDSIDETIEKEKEINFYRVLQEATKNILKHSEASQASVMVKLFETEIRVTLWDDGKGFAMKKMEGLEGLGFRGMKERVENLGGSLVVQSSVGEGTVIKLVIPINKNGYTKKPFNSR